MIARRWLSFPCWARTRRSPSPPRSRPFPDPSSRGEPPMRRRLRLLQDRPGRTPFGPGLRNRGSDRVPGHRPVNLGHLLVVPRRHHENVLDLADEEAARIGGLLPRLCKAVNQVSGIDGFHIIVNNGRVAGRRSFTAAGTSSPRFAGDAVHWPWPHQHYADGSMADYQSKIIQAARSRLIDRPAPASGRSGRPSAGRGSPCVCSLPR